MAVEQKRTGKGDRTKEERRGLEEMARMQKGKEI